ncbi:MAG: alpha-L-rhamnosidase, partial [Planctomycetia bacterium]|nr:alpha-L-rhamnosidase [Planctomycetia bacterium]
TPVLEEHLRRQEIAAWQAMLRGEQTVSVPPHTTVSVLWDLGDYYCGLSQAVLSGGAGSDLSFVWAEALFERPLSRASKHKGHRRQFIGKYCRGPRDSFRNDGGQGRAYTACWWRSGCLVLVTVRTADEPLVVNALSFRETRYPLEPQASFACDRPEVERIVRFCVRGLQMSAHEAFVDPHYEQTMYVGDTRLQDLASYVLSADRRLAERCIELFDWSRRWFGFTNSAYPYENAQLISTFPLYWVLMLRDHAWWRDDGDFVRQRLSGMRANLDAFATLCSQDGLVHSAPGWAFIDTVPEWIGTLYSPDSARGLSSTFNLLHALALQAAAEMEDWAQEPELAARWRRRADAIVRAVTAACWDEGRTLMADYPDRSAWSQHAQIMALLTGAVPEDAKATCLDAMLRTPGLAAAQPMFWMFYLFEAFHALGQGGRVLEYLPHWTDLMDKTGLRTPYEMCEPARSDCHAWGSHPLFHLHATVAGIRPGSPLFASVDIAPDPGGLTRLHSRIPHPRGFIDADFTFTPQGVCRARIDLPPGIPGRLRWRGEAHELHPGVQEIVCQPRE